MAPPTKYQPEYARIAERMCRLGAIDRDLCGAFGCTRSTLGEWKNAHPEFKAALDAGKAVADDAVELSLYERARGYSHDAVKIHVGKDGDVTKVDYVEHYAPDTAACIFWLKNRRPDRWKERIEHAGDPNNPLITAITVKFKKADGGDKDD